MIGVGIGYLVWAKNLGVTSPIVFGTLLIIEGLGGLLISLTEWWRISHAGVSLGLVMGGFLLPFTEETSVAVPVGEAFLIGSLASAAVLFWQLRYYKSLGANTTS